MAVFAAFLIGATVLYNSLSKGYSPDMMEETPSGQEENIGEEQEYEPIIAPDFTMYDIDGNAVSLSDYYGKPLVINFWASWCGVCQNHMPVFQAAYEEYGDEINFLMVNMTDGQRETVEKASEYIADGGYTFPVYYDSDMDAAYTYGVRYLPTTYFADSEGYLIAHANSMVTEDMMAQGIGMIYPQQ